LELGNSTPNLNPMEGQLPDSLRILIFVASVKSPTSLVELAPAARLSGIGGFAVRELMLKKFCATPEIWNSTFGDNPMLMPRTPTRVRSPVNPDAGNFAFWKKSIPA